MDDTSENIIDREIALANFDHARDDFVRAFGQVPDKAFRFRLNGIDREMGDLLPHMIRSLHLYDAVLDALVPSADDVAQPFQGRSVQSVQERDAAVQTLYAGGEGRSAVLDELERAHDELAGRLREMAHKEYSRRSPVQYPASEEPLPTSAADILEWLTGHYNECIARIWQGIEDWEKSDK